MGILLWAVLPMVAACDSETNSTAGNGGSAPTTTATTGGGEGGAGGAGGGSAEAVYVNPVLPGDYPDPSVIRVGDEYWAAATTSEWGPVYPLLRSKDLVNWEHMGPIWNERPTWSYANYWAPEIQEDNGRFFIYYTAHKINGPLCVAVASADAPSGPYVDHGPLVCQQVGSIDGFSVRDENGVRFLVWKEDSNSVGMPTTLWAQELSDDGKMLMGQPTELFKNEAPWEANLVEGPFILKRDDMFYMFYSGAGCCGKGCTYSLGVARSKNLLGPWEKNPNNPILTPNAEWKCPGHGSIVNDDKGRYWLLYHAYSVKDSVYPGRQGLLDEVVFGEDGWPTMNAGMGPSSMAPAPIAPQLPRPAEFVDEFTEDKLGIGWQWLVAYDMPPVTIDPMNGGRLVVQASPPVIGKNAGTIVARSSRVGDYEATTEVTPDASVSAGLAAVGDGDNALGISVVDGQAIVWRLGNGMSQQLAQETAAGTMTLQMKASQGHLYSFSVSEDQGKTWKPVGEQVDSASVDPDLPPWDRAVRIGLVATGGAGTTAKFEYLRINAPVANPPAAN